MEKRWKAYQEVLQHSELREMVGIFAVSFCGGLVFWLVIFTMIAHGRI